MYINYSNKNTKENQKPREKLLWGLLFIFGGYLIYNQLNNFETSGGTIHINIILYFIYKNFGKDIVSIIFVIFGIIKIISGILDYRNIKHWKEIEILKEEKRKITLNNDENYYLARELSVEMTNYLTSLKLEIIENQLYMHYWTEELICKGENDENWLNQAKYFWTDEETFANKSLPETFKNYQHRNFIFKKSNEIIEIKPENVFLNNETTATSKKYYCEGTEKIYLIKDLLETGLIEYIQIEELDLELIQNIIDNPNNYYFLIINHKIKYDNHKFYIGNNEISIEIAYSIGGIEIIKKNEIIAQPQFSNMTNLVYI